MSPRNSSSPATSAPSCNTKLSTSTAPTAAGTLQAPSPTPVDREETTAASTHLFTTTRSLTCFPDGWRLVDYDDAGRRPANLSIDHSAGCQIALAAIAHLKTVTATFLNTDADADSLPPVDETWIAGILSQISHQARAGRDIPLRHDGAHQIVITEGAVRALIRAAGDSLPGLIVGGIRFRGDITQPDTPIGVEVEATARWGYNIPASADDLKRATDTALRTHTRLNVTTIDIIVRDVLNRPGS